MKKEILSFIFLSFLPFFVCSQISISVENVMNYNTEKTNFSNEWQYLSTDVYLLNTHLFEKLLTQLTENKDKKNKNLQYLYLSISVKNEKFFHNTQAIEYPIYNFKIAKNKKGKYKYNINSSAVESIRIIDKFPLSSTYDNTIDATIKGMAVLYDNNKNLIINQLIAQQLLNISTISPTKIALSLIGEYGKLLQTSQKGINYQFTYGINLYKEKNPQMKLHSLKIYVLKPNNETKTQFTKAKEENIKQFLDTKKYTLQKNTLQKNISYRHYPYLIIANYRSIYKSETVSNYTEIDKEKLKENELEIRNLKKKDLINEEIFNQEMEYIAYLKKINEVKEAIKTFKKYKNKGKKKQIKERLPIILDKYKSLSNKLKFYETNFQNNTTYLNVFQTKYIDTYNFLSSELESDKDLKMCKELISLTLFLDKNISSKINDAIWRNKYLQILNHLDFETYFSNTNEGKKIKTYLKQLEEKEFENNFSNLVNQLNKSKIDSSFLFLKDSLKTKISISFCKKCKEIGEQTILNFDKKHQLYEEKKLHDKQNKKLQNHADELFSFFILLECVEKKLQDTIIIKKLGIAKNAVFRKQKKLKEKIILLDEKINLAKDEKSFEKVTILLKEIEDLFQEIKLSYDMLCKYYDFLCDC